MKLIYKLFAFALFVLIVFTGEYYLYMQYYPDNQVNAALKQFDYSDAGTTRTSLWFWYDTVHLFVVVVVILAAVGTFWDEVVALAKWVVSLGAGT